MDRQAWVAITVCVLGLIGWYAYTATHLPPRQPAPIAASPTPGSSPTAATSPSASASASPPLAVSSPSATPAESIPTFAEKTETLANGDVELHLTNRGGAITDAVLLNHSADNGNRVALDAADRTPIGAIVAEPDTPELPEFPMQTAVAG